MNYSAISGIICAGLFVIPAIRQELRRRQYATFLRQSKFDNDKELIDAVKNYMVNNLIRWDCWDSIFILIGLFFLLLSFILEIN